MLLREGAAESLAAGVDRAAEDDAVWARKIDVLEDALLVRLSRGETDRLQTGSRDANHFAGFDFADVPGVQEIKSAGFRSDEPRVAQSAEHQGAEAAG